MPTTDATLLRRLGDGDGTAYREIVSRFASPALALATRVTRNRDLAEDAVQDAFVEVWRRSARFDPARGDLRSWVMTVVHHKAVDTVRREDASTRVADHAPEPGTGPDPEEVGVNTDLRERVQGALDDLTPAQREAISLAYFGGRTYREVAKELGIPEGTAKSRLRDGLLNLRGLMERHGIEWSTT